MGGDIIVLGLGSSVLRQCSDLQTAVHEIYRWYRAGWRVVTVVSATSNSTDSLLGPALDRAGIPSRIVDPREVGLTVEDNQLDREPVAINCERIEILLRESPVIVMPGSDLSAMYLATALRANRCRLVKDVDGVYECDPAIGSDVRPRRYLALTYADAMACAAPLIQPKAVQFLERNSAHVEVAGVLSPYESIIGRFTAELVESRKMPPTSVLLLGLGTVGLGVYQRIVAMPEHFRVIGALVRERAKHIANGVLSAVLYDSVDDFVNVQAAHADVVVDALPGLEMSQILVREFLSRGLSVVSANKRLIAEVGPELAALAARHRASLHYSAAVGGSAPMLEALRREAQRGEIRSVAGILNGTCNYVLDRCAEGLLIHEAARCAHEAGFAEADPSEDLSGRDAARKLRILARHAFRQDLSAFEVEPLNAAAVLRMRAALRANETLRIIARAWKLGSGVFGQIQLEAVAADDAFAQTRGEWNRLVITRANGEDVVVCGRGAGRWPTTEAIIGDLLEMRLAGRMRNRPNEQ